MERVAVDKDQVEALVNLRAGIEADWSAGRRKNIALKAIDRLLAGNQAVLGQLAGERRGEMTEDTQTPPNECEREPAELWEPDLPDPSPGPEGVPKEDDPGPDA